MKPRRKRNRSFFHEHSLSIVAIGILVLWLGLYVNSSPDTHIGSFFGNAIADWLGVVVVIIATKYFYEQRWSGTSYRNGRRFWVSSF